MTCGCSPMDLHDYGPCGADCDAAPTSVQSPRERMEAAGWFHVIDDECNMGWWRCYPNSKTVADYHPGPDTEKFERELSEHTAAALRDGWTP